MPHGKGARLLALAVLVVAALALVKPFSTSYADVRGSDFIVNRQASCGAPIVAAFHADPGLGGGTGTAFGTANARRECQRVVRTRVASGVALMLVVGAASVITVWFVRRARRRADAEHQAATITT